MSVTRGVGRTYAGQLPPAAETTLAGVDAPVFGASAFGLAVMRPNIARWCSMVTSTSLSVGTLPEYSLKPPPQQPGKRLVLSKMRFFLSITTICGLVASGRNSRYSSPLRP